LLIISIVVCGRRRTARTPKNKNQRPPAKDDTDNQGDDDDDYGQRARNNDSGRSRPLFRRMIFTPFVWPFTLIIGYTAHHPTRGVQND
jgi:hypothetical protein